MTGVKQTRLETIARELAAIRAEQRPISSEAELRARAHDLDLSALCLSGGGIRSAAFCLGVLQALAGARLLARFDYLSTVSGGGYIGAWLQGMVHRRGSVDAVQTALADPACPPTELLGLRNYTSYLAPQRGPFSADSWTDLVLYLRNVLLNWAVYLPLLAFPLLLAIFYRTAIAVVAFDRRLQLGLIAASAVALAVSIFCVARELPDHRPPPIAANYATPRAVTALVYWPAVAWAMLAALSQGRGSGLIELPAQALLISYAAAMTLGYAAAWVAAVWRDPQGQLFHLNAISFGAATMVSAAAIAIGLHLMGLVPMTGQRAQVVAVLGPLWLLGSLGIHSAVFVGLRRDSPLFDLDREWLARLSALKLRAGALWGVLAFASLSLTWLLTLSHTPPGKATAPIVVALGSVAAWIGKQASTNAGAIVGVIRSSQRWRLLALNLLCGVFILGLIAVLGMIADRILGGAQKELEARFPVLVAPQPSWRLLIIDAAAIALLFCMIVWVTQRVNVNRYSMHAVYRNRLTRAFLGPARGPARQPDPFTNLDPADNFPLAWLADATGRRTLFPVINLTLNMTAGAPTGWSERKAMAFTATPVACGAPLLRPDTQPASRDADPQGVYVTTHAYAGLENRDADPKTAHGLSLATAMTISGAAVSPNWGYHSSRLTAFVMTLFNMRLGAWLPNPAAVTRPAELNLARPPHSLRTLLGDLLGSAGDQSPAIYLSDGGHFDNLGLYEMVRRRCRKILVVDASEDASCGFESLGDTLRKAAIDMQVRIEFDSAPRIVARTDAAGLKSALGFAVATVCYPECPDDRTSKLIYLKPCLLANVPTDVRAYANLHELFPHESTLEQSFTESQFESYRALGEYQASQLIGAAAPADLDELFVRAGKA